MIQIHVPFLKGSYQEILYRWYDEGLDLFHHNSSAAQAVADQLAEQLHSLLYNTSKENVDSFINRTYTIHHQLKEQLHQGRDPLLELNSCRKDVADRLIQDVCKFEQEGALWPYLEELFDCYGVDTEYHSPNCFIIRPSDHMRVTHFPELSEDGLTLTISRDVALEREELQFMTWEHPLVIGAMDLVISSDTGNATVSVVKNPDLKAGQFLLECLFIIECSAPAELQIGRFLPHTPIRILIDQTQKNRTEQFSHESLMDSAVSFDKGQIVAFLNKQRNPIVNLLDIAEQYAKKDMVDIIAAADQAMLTALGAEVRRLARLQKINPAIKAEEIEELKDFTLVAHEHIQGAQLRLDAVRFIITH